MPNALVKVALPAVELPKKRISTLLVTVALPAVEVAPNFKAALLVKLALPAVALSPKVMSPVLVKSVKLPAVALPKKFITVGPETKFWVIPELFVMPTPLMVKAKKGLVIVNALAPGLNTMPLTSVVAEMTGRFILEVANVAVSAGPLGGPLATQLAALFQSVLAAVAFQVALPAKLLLAVASRSVSMAVAEGRKAHARGRQNGWIRFPWNDLLDRNGMLQTKNTK
jgi:hypothetical protein